LTELKVVYIVKMSLLILICKESRIVHLHHIIPRSRGGKDEISNYVGLCPTHHMLVHNGDYYIEQINNKWQIIEVHK